MTALPQAYQRILGHLLERERLAAIDKQLAALGMPARRPGLATIEDAARTMLDAASFSQLLHQHVGYVSALKAQRQALLDRHGYRQVHDEDGTYWTTRRHVRPVVRRRIAKLSRLIELAERGQAWPVQAYHFELQCRPPGISERTLNRWLARM